MGIIQTCSLFSESVFKRWCFVDSLTLNKHGRQKDTAKFRICRKKIRFTWGTYFTSLLWASALKSPMRNAAPLNWFMYHQISFTVLCRATWLSERCVLNRWILNVSENWNLSSWTHFAGCNESLIGYSFAIVNTKLSWCHYKQKQKFNTDPIWGTSTSTWSNILWCPSATSP